MNILTQTTWWAETNKISLFMKIPSQTPTMTSKDKTSWTERLRTWKNISNPKLGLPSEPSPSWRRGIFTTGYRLQIRDYLWGNGLRLVRRGTMAGYFSGRRSLIFFNGRSSAQDAKGKSSPATLHPMNSLLRCLEMGFPNLYWIAGPIATDVQH